MIKLRDPKSPIEIKHADECPGRDGVVKTVGSQDTVRCATCDRFLYNAPKTETGRAVRSVTTVHSNIKPKQRARILERATGACELCHTSGAPLHVGHLLSVARGIAEGLTDSEINSDENLAAFCDQCNLGMGKQPVPVRLVVAILIARTRRAAESKSEAAE